MNYSQIKEAKELIKSLDQINYEFLNGCIKNSESKELDARLLVTGSSIEIDCFGQKAKAVCKFVRSKQGDLAAEYVFNITQGESQVEVWRCYVTAAGHLVKDLSGQNLLCDYNNTYIATHICGSVLLGALHSKVFAITEIEGG